jgi:ABC-type Fe3+ transport system permease subunit
MWLHSLAQTWILMAAVSAIALPVSLLLGACIAKNRIIGVHFALAILSAMIAVPIYVQAGAWNSMFGQFGWWTMTQVGASQNPLGGMPAVVWIYAVSAIPWLTFVFVFGFLRSNRRIEEAGSIEADWLTVLLRIQLPLLSPFILLATLLLLILVSVDMTITNLYRVSTVTEMVYQQVSAGHIDQWTWVTPLLSVPLIAFVFTALHNYCFRALWKGSFSITNTDRFLSTNQQIPYQTLLQRVTYNTLFWSVLLLIGFLPILNLIWNAGWISPVMAEGKAGYWSIGQLVQSLQATPIEFREEFGWSLYIGVVTASCWLFAGLATSLFAMRFSAIRNPLGVFCLLLVFLPGPLVGLFTIWFWNRSEPQWFGWLYDHTLIGPITALGFRMFPAAYLASDLCLRRVPASLIEASRLEGYGQTRFLLGWLSRSKGYLLACWLLLFLLSLADLSAILLVVPPGVTPISARIFELLHYGVRYQEAGVCLTIASMSMFLGFVILQILSFGLHNGYRSGSADES